MRRAGLLLLAGALAAGAEEPVRLPAPEPEPAVAWFGIYLRGRKVGWLREETAPQPYALRVRWERHLRLAASGRDWDLVTRGERVYDPAPPHRLREHAQHTLANGAPRSSVRAVREGDAYAVRFESAGGVRGRRVALDYTWADATTPARWLAGPRRPGDRLVGRGFDGSEVRVVRELHVVRAVRDGVREGELVRAGAAGRFRVDARGVLLSATLAGSIELRRETEAEARAIERSEDLFAAALVPIARKLGEPDLTWDLVLEARGEGAGAIPDGPRQRVECRDGDVWVVRLGARHARRVPATAAEVADALRETRALPCRDERIVETARRVTAGAGSDTEKVRALLAFVARWIDDEPAELDNALDVLARRRGDCTEHALLFVALARAVGLPARRVSGLVYLGDERRAFGGHAWCEVVLDGAWWPVDPSREQLTIDATHLALGHGERGGPALLETLGRLELEVLLFRATGTD